MLSPGRHDIAASHIPLLVRVFDISKGDVLEVGTGYYSTLILHWLASLTERKLVSYENHKRWYRKAVQWESALHQIVLCQNWDIADFDNQHWGMAFVDHSPGYRRPREVARLANLAEYIVIHDTQPRIGEAYQFSQTWGQFKYCYHYTKIVPCTTVVSNFHELLDVI
jgi:hypothetical protein